MTIAIDGSLYRHHPNMHDIMMAWLAFLVPNTKVNNTSPIKKKGYKHLIILYYTDIVLKFLRKNNIHLLYDKTGKAT